MCGCCYKCTCQRILNYIAVSVPCLVPIPTPAGQVCETTRPLPSEPVDLLCMHVCAMPCRGAHRMPGPHLKTNSRHASFMAKCQSHSWCHVQLGKSAKPNDLFQACLAPPSLASCCMRRVVHAWRSKGGWQAWDKARSAQSALLLRSGNVVRCRHAKDAACDGSGKIPTVRMHPPLT